MEVRVLWWYETFFPVWFSGNGILQVWTTRFLLQSTGASSTSMIWKGKSFRRQICQSHVHWKKHTPAWHGWTSWKTCAAVCTTIARKPKTLWFFAVRFGHKIWRVMFWITGHAVPFASEDYSGTCYQSSVWQERILPKWHISGWWRCILVQLFRSPKITHNWTRQLGGGFNIFISLPIFLPLIKGKWSNLTSLFFIQTNLDRVLNQFFPHSLDHSHHHHRFWVSTRLNQESLAAAGDGPGVHDVMWWRMGGRCLEFPWILASSKVTFWWDISVFEGKFGCFRKWWYPQIIHFNRVFHYKPSILGYPYFWKHPFVEKAILPLKHDDWRKVCGFVFLMVRLDLELVLLRIWFDQRVDQTPVGWQALNRKQF